MKITWWACCKCWVQLKYCRSCICSYTPKIVLDSSHMTAVDTGSFDNPFKLPELRDSRKVVAASQGVLADFRSQMIVRIRTRPDSAHFDARRRSTNLQPNFCPSLVFYMLVVHLGLFILLSTFSGTDDFFVIDKTPYTFIATEVLQLRFRRFLGC